MMTMQFDNFILNNIFSFVTDESDRDAIYNVSRHFRRMYRHVAPSNAYRFALMCNNVYLARILFDMERIVPDYNMLSLAIQRGQLDHATELFAHLQSTVVDQFGVDQFGTLLICAFAAFSKPLTLLVEQYFPKEKAPYGLRFDNEWLSFEHFAHNAFVAVCEVPVPDDNRHIDFLRWLIETKRLAWSYVSPKTIARYATIPLVALFLETGKYDDEDFVMMHVLAAIVGFTHQPTSLLQQFVLDSIDRMNSESAKKLFLRER
jgi:hypothetical protein